ncbi:MAG TPA: DUF6515 family protein [bacterium]
MSAVMSVARALGAAIAGLWAVLLLGQVAAAADRGRVEVAQRRGRATFASDWDDWNGGWGGSWNYDWTLMQMQRNAISTQEEQAREAGRAVRRDELEQTRQKDAAESDAYFQSILEASQAALRAPRGVYYRKPGYTSTEAPGPGAAPVQAGGVSYFYDRGIFWLQQGTTYIVVTAPPGAMVPALPAASVRIPFGDKTYWYFFGTFFAEQAGGYAVVSPPAGLTVYYLPDGYTQDKAGGANVFRFGDTLFKPVFVQGVLAYQVVAGS